MNYEDRLKNGSITIDQLEEMVLRSNNEEDEKYRLAELEIEEEEIAIEEEIRDQLRMEREELEMQEREERQKIKLEKEEVEMLSSASPELLIAINNVKALEAQLAVQEWENKRLTALVSVLELKIRDLMTRR